MRMLFRIAVAAALWPATAAADQAVAIRFAGTVGEQPFACGRSYEGIGSTRSTITPSDFRFYVSEVALIASDGRRVPVKLADDGKWQDGAVALLDFEDKSGPCANGTAETRDTVQGTVADGSYVGLAFTLGVPFARNHQDATIAGSPLNLTSLFWNWQAGYKFLRVDMATAGLPQVAPMHGHVPKFGDRHGSMALGFALHLGSTGCTAAAGTQPPSACSNPNRPAIVLDRFDAARDVVAVDLARLLADTNLDANQPETPAGCMSSPNDGDCSGIMRHLGLGFGGQPSGEQRLFRVVRQ